MIHNTWTPATPGYPEQLQNLRANKLCQEPQRPSAACSVVIREPEIVRTHMWSHESLQIGSLSEPKLTKWLQHSLNIVSTWAQHAEISYGPTVRST